MGESSDRSMNYFPTVFIVAVLLSLLGCSQVSVHILDEEMIGSFDKHRALFEEMVSMVLEDEGLRRVDDNWTDPRDPGEAGVSLERIEKYRYMFRECNVSRGISAFHKDEKIQFIVTSRGLATGGSMKGYEYRIVPLSDQSLVSSIDDHKPPNPRGYVIYKHIEGPWYLVYEYDG